MQSSRAFVFASDTSVGNEACVVIHERDEMAPSDMQRFAAERAVPVVVFLERQRPEWRVRFFTQKTELPYCGHGVLAAGRIALDCLGVSETALVAGAQRVIVKADGAQVVALTTRPSELSEEHDPEAVEACFSFPAGSALRPIYRGSIGSQKWLVRVSDAAALYRVELDAERLSALTRERGVNGAYMYTRGGLPAGIDAEARGFNPASGAIEDSATGVGAGALAWALHRDSPEKTRFVIVQGKALGQDNHIVVELGADGSTQVGGTVRVAQIATR